MTPLMLFPLLTCLLASSQSVYVVDAAFGPGADFRTIDEAVSAAFDGNIVLVREGVYPSAFDSVILDLFGIAVVAERGATVRTGSLICDNHASLNPVLVQGITFSNNGTTGSLIGNLAPVWLERTQFEPGPVIHPPPFGTGFEALDCSSVVLIRSTVESIPGALGGHPWAMSGGNSRLHLFSSLVQGASAFRDDLVSLVLDQSFLQLFGSQVLGAEGADGSPFFPLASEGGDALEIGPTSQVRILDSEVRGGAGGTPYPNGTPEPDGQAIVGGGSATFLSGAAKALELTSPVREGEIADLIVRGRPGDQVWLLYSPRPALGTVIPGLLGELLLPATATFGIRGTIPAGGLWVRSFTVPQLAPGREGTVFYCQALVRDALTGRYVTSSPSAMVVLDSSL